MAGEKTYTSKDGSLWIQPDGPGTKPEYLGCYDLGDLKGDDGSIDLIQCFDPNGRYRTRGFTTKPPAPIKTTLTTWVGKTAEFLEDLPCPFILHVHLRCGGRADIFSNWERGFVLDVAHLSSRTIKNLVMRAEDKAAEEDFDIEILPPFLDLYQVTPLRQGISETVAANDIYFMDYFRCASDCAAAVALGDIGVIGMDAGAGAKANTYITTNGGQTWTVAAADAFANDEHIFVALYFYIGANTIRYIVGRGSTDAGNPAEIAYSDDGGATWTNVNVGSTNAQFFANAKTIYIADQFNMWAVTTGGYIYKSEDGGVTWSTQHAGTLTTQALHRIRFEPGSALIGYACGASNTILKTIDGGVTWSLVTGPSGGAGAVAQALDVVDANHVYVGYSNGKIYFTADGGANWTEQTFSGSGAGAVKDIQMHDSSVGYMLHNTAGPVGSVFITTNGGYTWEALTTPTNVGLNSIVVLKTNLAFAAGEVQSSTPVVLKVS